MKQKSIKLVLTSLIALSVISCASAPQKSAALPDYLIQARTAAEDSRAKAMEIKANVAVKDIFDQAENGFSAAKGLEAAGDYEKAAAGYTGSADLYKKAYDAAALKKEAALKSMDKATEERKTTEAVLTKAAEEQAAAEQPTAGETGKGE